MILCWYFYFTFQDGFCHIQNMTTKYPIRGFTDVTPYSVEALKVILFTSETECLSLGLYKSFKWISLYIWSKFTLKWYLNYKYLNQIFLLDYVEIQISFIILLDLKVVVHFYWQPFFSTNFIYNFIFVIPQFKWYNITAEVCYKLLTSNF